MTSSRKNILVLKNYTITDHTQWYDDRTNEENLVDNYAEMEKICVASAQENIQDLDEICVFRGEASNIRDVFKINFFEIYDLWKQGHNILYADLDVVFMNPCEMFDKTYLFSMYNLTDPPTTSDSHYDVEFPFYFNCGMRYYPHKMLQEVWDIGIEMFDNYYTDRWDAEQIIYNSMTGNAFWTTSSFSVIGSSSPLPTVATVLCPLCHQQSRDRPSTDSGTRKFAIYTIRSLSSIAAPPRRPRRAASRATPDRSRISHHSPAGAAVPPPRRRRQAPTHTRDRAGAIQ